MTPEQAAELKRLAEEYVDAVQAEIADLTQKLEDYKEVHASHRATVRKIDVILNGEAGAAKQASLCDLVRQIEDARKDAERYRWLRDNVEQVYARPRTEIACDWGMKWQIKPYLVAVSAVATDVTFDAAIDAAMTNEG